MRPFGIERQTLLVALLPILLMGVLLENYFIHSRFTDLQDAFLERSQLLARQLASSSEYAVFSNNTELLQRNIDSVLALQDVSRLAVLDSAGRQLASGGTGDRRQIEAQLAKASAAVPVYQGEDSLILYEPIAATQIKLDELDRENGLTSGAAKPLGAVVIEFSTRRLAQKQHEILLFSIAVTLLILLAALMLALRVARRIVRPVQGMSQAINSFGGGNLDARISPLPRVRELGELATGFNQMARNLQQQHELLEARVAERTAALAASEQESRMVIENSPDTICRYDRELRRIYANPAFIKAAGGSNELLGKRPSELQVGPNAEMYEERLRKVIETGANDHFELVWPGKDGKDICSSIRLAAERDLSGAVVSVLAVGRDITELHESKGEITRKELAKSRFLAAAGHDLRQPLAAANLFIDALKITPHTPDQGRIIQRLDQTMSTFNELLEALLDISKLDAGTIKPECAPVSVIEIFNWIEQSFEPMARQKRLGFRLHLPLKAALIVHSDMKLVKSVLMNLVSNGIKYTPEGGILVSARRRAGSVLFQVWDTGIGMRPENIEHIFDEFYQINNPQRDRTSGLGLGLAIAKRAITLLDSRIACRSRLGRGSVFEFSLPLDSSMIKGEPASAARPLFDNSAQISFVRGKRFIVVEDDAMVSEAIRQALEIMHGKVRCFNSADAALQATGIEHADYYIADYMMGGSTNGMQFLNQLSRKAERPIRAVLMTGDTSPDFIRATQGCSWPVLYKPINISRLIAKLDEQHGDQF